MPETGTAGPPGRSSALDSQPLTGVSCGDAELKSVGALEKYNCTRNAITTMIRELLAFVLMAIPAAALVALAIL
jgi:hypothetical protein